MTVNKREKTFINMYILKNVNRHKKGIDEI